MARRYVIYGVGAVGGTIGGLLAGAGCEVAVIARGAHREAVRDSGLRLHRPEGAASVRFSAVASSPREIDWRDDDIVVLGMKTQDTLDALDLLRDAAPATVSIVCAQNGVENERIAHRRFADVHGMCVMLPATHLEPGVVVAHGAPAAGILDLGRFPGGVDGTDEQLSADLRAAGFSSEPQPRIMRWKYAKLRLNLGNAIEAACGRAARGSDLYDEVRAEAEACFAAAGIDVASEHEDRARRDGVMRIAPVEGQTRGGGSSWQSLARGTGSIETDYLNGEIVLLGRLNAVPVPINAGLQWVAARLAARRVPPESMTLDELRSEITRVAAASGGT